MRADTTTAWFDTVAESGSVMQIFCDWQVPVRLFGM
jgi:hypothetical protein